MYAVDSSTSVSARVTDPRAGWNSECFSLERSAGQLEPEETDFVVSIRLRMRSLQVAAAEILVVEACSLTRLREVLSGDAGRVTRGSQHELEDSWHRIGASLVRQLQVTSG